MRGKNIKTIIENGGEGILVDVECSLSNSLPNIVIVGFANKSTDEAKERIKGAFSASSIKLPRKRITLNLAPADIPKEGSSFDLAMIISILQAGGLVKTTEMKNTVALGEVGLDGSVRAIRGIIGKLLAARKKGVSKFLVPRSNLKQASLVPNIDITPVNNLGELYSQLNHDEAPKSVTTSDSLRPAAEKNESEVKFEDIAGQEQAKRAMLIAAAGGHNIMLNGPPGTGKSMLAKSLINILPPMDKEEMLEVTQLHSLARKDFDRIIKTRPIRAPHHSSSHISIIGGGQTPKPGEISLSHKGVLFLDEFPEFGRSVIEALRQPMEDRKVTVSRAKDSFDFPADFIFVATANPCPCGNYGSKIECTCLPAQIIRYHKKISGPIIDRVDLHIYVESVSHSSILKQTPKNDGQTLEMSEKVKKARKIQQERGKALNSSLNNRTIKSKTKLTQSAEELLNQAAERLNMSARGYMKTLKVSRTIADIDGLEAVGTSQVGEALQYRSKPLVL